VKRYRNIDTGAMIETHNTIRGEKWREEKTPAVSPVKNQAKKKTVKKE